MKKPILSLVLLTIFASVTTAQRNLTPLVDHQMHIASVNASALTVEPLMSVVELPKELTLLLRNKERWGGREKDVAALTDLYTPDALVLDPVSPPWFRGERAVNYVIRGTVINRLVPTAFAMNGNSGYIAGYEAAGEGASTEYVSNFFMSAQRPATRNLYFDVAELELVLRGRDESLKKAAALMRRIGFRRIIWGSDGPKFGDAPSRESWTKFRTTVPLTQHELRVIAGNIAPYLR